MSIAPACLIESISAETSLTVAVETRRRMISRVLRATSCDATCWRRRSSAMNREHSPATFGLIGGVAVALIGLAGALSTWHDLAAPAFAPASQREPARHRPTARSEHSEVRIGRPGRRATLAVLHHNQLHNKADTIVNKGLVFACIRGRSEHCAVDDVCQHWHHQYWRQIKCEPSGQCSALVAPMGMASTRHAVAEQDRERARRHTPRHSRVAHAGTCVEPLLVEENSRPFDYARFRGARAYE